MVKLGGKGVVLFIIGMVLLIFCMVPISLAKNEETYSQLEIFILDPFIGNIEEALQQTALEIGLGLSVNSLSSRDFLQTLQRQKLFPSYDAAMVSIEQAASADKLNLTDKASTNDFLPSSAWEYDERDSVVYQSCIVFLINRNFIEKIPFTWKELGDSRLPVIIPNTDLPAGKAAVLACAIALGGDEGNLTPAFNFFRGLKKNDLLSVSNVSNVENWNAHPVSIMWDYHALNIKNAPGGEIFEIVVPMDGTLVSGSSILLFNGNRDQENLKDILKLKEYLFNSQGQTILALNGFFPIHPELVEDNVLGNLLPAEIYQKAASVNNFETWENTSASFKGNWRRIVEKRPGTVTVYQKSLFAALCILCMILANTLLFLRAKKSPALKSFMFLQLCLIWWLFLRFLKYFLFTDTIIVSFWYAEYLGIIMLGPAFWAVGYTYYKERFPSTKSIIMTVSLGLCLFILVGSNSLHEQVFAFDHSKYFWYNNYTYGLPFYVVITYITILVTTGMIFFLLSMGKSPHARRQVLYVVLGTVTAFLINLLYIFPLKKLGIPHPNIWFDTPQLIGLVSLTFITGAVNNRFLEPETGLEPFLRDSGVMAAVVNINGLINWSSRSFVRCFGSPGSFTREGLEYLINFQRGEELPWEKIKEFIPEPEKNPLQGKKMFLRTMVFKVGANYAFVLSDVSKYRQMLMSLWDRKQQLERIKNILEGELSLTETTTAAKERKAFTSGLDTLMSKTLNEIKSEINTLSTGTGLQAKRSSLQKIKFKSFYCHQLLRLYLYSMQRISMNHESAASFLKAIVNQLQTCGIKAELFTFGKAQAQINEIKAMYQILYIIFFSLQDYCEEFLVPKNLLKEQNNHWLIRYTSSAEELTLTILMPSGITLPSPILLLILKEIQSASGVMRFHDNQRAGSKEEITALHLIFPGCPEQKEDSRHSPRRCKN
ncbi:histidine kinase N-terminal 7TM domain-containing protein [Candidatus Contubernalis alkaliaceticus]|uniref:histidine kinase N-terminal 7TM domain-containing protein n=1 Tax=Candidatus Contubernalis alkaliaceticus TaxID=338645 RepID=UPI001F4BDBF1|nr:histidine kinase N-terminal 7TM domain-containing protein [Candidatus Contubernalis alkalaceticus]UNC91451.1 ABC transporter substrate-binding protein [Candidatus Contubernalis alkalaceticus]